MIISNIKKDNLPGVYRAMREVRRVYEKNNPNLLTYLDGEAFLHLGISLMHRLSEDPDFDRILKNNTAYLDREFPLWRDNPYIRLSYVIRNNGSNLKVWMIRLLYRLGLFPLFLKCYRFMIDRLKTDVKW